MSTKKKVKERKKERKKEMSMRMSSGPEQFLGSYVVNRVLHHPLSAVLGWGLPNQRKKERKNGLLYRGPSVGKDLGIYRGEAKQYRGFLYQLRPMTKFFWHLCNLLIPFLPGLTFGS